MNAPERDIDCEIVQQHFFELRDGTLDSASMEHVQSHLQVCERCRRVQAWDNQFAEMLRENESPISPAQLLGDVRGRVRRRRRMRTAMSFAAAAAIIVGVALVLCRPWRDAREVRPIANRPEQPATNFATDDLAELSVLAEPPPVDSLDVLARQQSGYVSMMRRIGEE
jgi:hypothetical protein